MTEKLYKMVNGEQVEMSETEAAETRAEWAANDQIQQAIDYEYMRKSAYPSVEEQLDMIYQDKIDGTDKWVTLITSIKNKHPKLQ